MRVAVLHTSRAPGLRYLLEEDRAQGHSYRLVAGLASDPASAELGGLAQAGVPTLVHDLAGFTHRRGARRDDLTVRRDYDRATVERLRPYRPELIVLCGYLHIATAPLLEAFPGRVINIHDSDLAVLEPGGGGRPRFRGLRSTRDAIFAGALETRSTVHLATADVDVGPLLLRSWSFPTHPMIHAARSWGGGAADLLKAYAYAQREWMMRAAWGPMLSHVIGRFAAGAVRLLDGRPVIAGQLGPEELDPPAPWRPATIAAGGSGV